MYNSTRGCGMSQLSFEHFPINAKKSQKEYRTYGRDELKICITGLF